MSSISSFNRRPNVWHLGHVRGGRCGERSSTLKPRPSYFGSGAARAVLSQSAESVAHVMLSSPSGVTEERILMIWAYGRMKCVLGKNGEGVELLLVNGDEVVRRQTVPTAAEGGNATATGGIQGCSLEWCRAPVRLQIVPVSR